MQNKNLMFLKIWFRILRNANIILIVAVYPNYVLHYSVSVLCKKPQVLKKYIRISKLH